MGNGCNLKLTFFLLPSSGDFKSVLRFLKFFDPLCQFLLQQSLIGQIQAIFGSVDIGIFRQGKFHHAVVLLLAKQYADSGLAT